MTDDGIGCFEHAKVDAVFCWEEGEDELLGKVSDVRGIERDGTHLDGISSTTGLRSERGCSCLRDERGRSRQGRVMCGGRPCQRCQHSSSATSAAPLGTMTTFLVSFPIKWPRSAHYVQNKRKDMPNLSIYSDTAPLPARLPCTARFRTRKAPVSWGSETRTCAPEGEEGGLARTGRWRRRGSARRWPGRHAHS